MSAVCAKFHRDACVARASYVSPYPPFSPARLGDRAIRDSGDVQVDDPTSRGILLLNIQPIEVNARHAPRTPSRAPEGRTLLMAKKGSTQASRTRKSGASPTAAKKKSATSTKSAAKKKSAPVKNQSAKKSTTPSRTKKSPAVKSASKVASKKDEKRATPAVAKKSPATSSSRTSLPVGPSTRHHQASGARRTRASRAEREDEDGSSTSEEYVVPGPAIGRTAVPRDSAPRVAVPEATRMGRRT
jgi:hypothetical protein